MANFFILKLDTIGPASPTLSLGGTYTANPLITATVGTSDGDTAGYEILFWGDIDAAWAKSNGLLPSGSSATSVTDTNAQWVSYATSKQLKLSAGDSQKTVYMKLRDKVYNQSSQVSATISLDSTLPIVEIVNGAADVDTVSSNTEKNTANFSFYSNEPFVEFKVCVVTSDSATQSQGTVIGTANGSVNTSGTGSYNANTNYTVTLKGADIKAISSPDGDKFIKVFVKDASGQWSA